MSLVLALVTGAGADDVLLAGEAEDTALARAVERWRDGLGEIPGTARLAAREDSGLRLIVPGDSEWPTQLDDLGDARPLLLWLRGSADLRLTCVNSVAVVGARAATAYGNHVAVEMTAVLAEHGVGVVSGGAEATKSQQRSPDCKATHRRPLPHAERTRVTRGMLALGEPVQGRLRLCGARCGAGAY